MPRAASAVSVSSPGAGRTTAPGAGPTGEAQIIPLSSAGAAAASPEPWVTKRRLAEHLGVTTRWIELQQQRGLPHLRMPGINRYRISEVETWLRERYASTTEKAA
jgi:hypothetical protein